ncbi:MAG: TonB-dependent receptor [Bacteroidales bacterium]
MRKIFVTLLLLMISLNVFAQSNKLSIDGYIKDGSSGEPLYMATVVIKEVGLWSTSDDKGHYIITGIPKGKYTIEVSMLGYETNITPIEIKDVNITLSISLPLSSLSLQEVVVTAKEGGEMNSSSKIEKQTLEHIQPSSLKDVMQLLPGSVTANPNLTSINSLSIRDFSNNSANVVGTALIIDGASVSNDANMQMLNSGTTTSGQSTAGGGVDARQVSTDNIESIEVIRGVPSAEYGNMTSGAVVVKTKAGVTPWEFRVKADPALKQVYAGKGFSLGEKNGVMNFDVDYALAYKDVRTVSDKYDRVNLQVGYSNNFKKKLTLNAKLSANYAKASSASDPDIFLDELEVEKDMGLRLNVNGKWIINKPWITNVEYIFSGGYTDQYSRNKSYVSAGRIPSATTMLDGESIGFFTPFQYYSDVEVFGAPVDAQAKIMATQFGKYGDVSNKVLIGMEYMMQGNLGEGKVFDITLPPSPGTASYRERTFKDIPFLYRYTAFAEDKLKYSFGEQYLELQAGARFSGVYASGVISDNLSAFEPRFNARYVILNKRQGFRNLSVRGGWGISYKMPSMVYLYPEDAYSDLVSFSYNDIDANNFGLAVITTKRVETANSNLKLQKSVNLEFGIDFDANIVSGSLVYYNEKLTNGYGFVTEYTPVVYKRYGYEWANGVPKQTILGSGVNPVYSNGNIYVAGQELPSISDTTFMSYLIPANGISNNKWGVEFTLDFPQIKAINTSINVSGAYMNIATMRDEMSQYLYGSMISGRSFPYVGIYAGSNTSSNNTIKEKFSTNVRFITHIPQIAMVVTLTMQMVFMENTVYENTYLGNSQVYYYDDNGVRVSGEEALKDETHVKKINPLYIMDRKGNVTAFTQDMEQDSQYRNLIMTTNTPTYYIKSGYPFYGLLNLRLTKEIKKLATISFYANNFLNFKGRVKNSVTGYAQDKNTPIYFGAEVKITIK